MGSADYLASTLSTGNILSSCHLFVVFSNNTSFSCLVDRTLNMSDLVTLLEYFKLH